MRKLAYTGLVVSLLGAAVDFVSGSAYAMPAAPGEMASTPSTEVALFVLGIIVLASGVLLVLPRMAASMRRLGLLMEVLGVVMVLTSYFVPGMNLASSYAMLIVGAAMILNGALMQRKDSGMARG